MKRHGLIIMLLACLLFVNWQSAVAAPANVMPGDNIRGQALIDIAGRITSYDVDSGRGIATVEFSGTTADRRDITGAGILTFQKYQDGDDLLVRGRLDFDGSLEFRGKKGATYEPVSVEGRGRIHGFSDVSGLGFEIEIYGARLQFECQMTS